ncbi:CHAT domain-containing protein [Moorena producens]|uniref:CHAT domain-containing protein n=1 Tax=Moorena producens TaxID=1155739 RepID=UPI003C73727A
MINLEFEDRRQLIKLLQDLPELATPQKRRQILEFAGLGQFVSRIDLSGETFTVVNQIISNLSSYGRLSDNQEALGVFLNALKDFVGIEQQQLLDRLLDKYQMTMPPSTSLGVKLKSDTQLRKILILSANPRGTSKLRLDEEMREIKEGLRRSKHRDQYSIDTAEAVRYRDIHRAILDYEPQIVHFSGHGAGEEGLVFEDETGQVTLVDAEAIGGLFELFADQVECVVLNACYSKVQALEIARHINYVVGMSKVISDKAAIEFAIGFYDALGAGRPVQFAYKLGCHEIRMARLAEHLTPDLIKKADAVESLKKN